MHRNTPADTTKTKIHYSGTGWKVHNAATYCTTDCECRI